MLWGFFGFGFGSFVVVVVRMILTLQDGLGNVPSFIFWMGLNFKHILCQ